MESRTKVLGHPAHTQVIVFPLGLLSTALIFDLLALATKNRKTAEAADAMLVSGLVGAAVAAPLGYRDWRAIPEGTRAKEIGRWHGIGNVGVTALFAASWLLRRNDPGRPPAGAPVALSLAGAGLALVTGWLGGELVYRLRVGVDEGAHLDAPSSLSDTPPVAFSDTTPGTVDEPDAGDASG
jgi:uncharacterized membrane protein